MKVEIDLSDFWDSWGDASMDEELSQMIREDIKKNIKKDPRYKELLQNKIKEAVDALK